MQTFAKNQRQETSTERGSSAKPAAVRDQSRLQGLLNLQKAIGNAAFGQIIMQAVADARARAEAEMAPQIEGENSSEVPVPSEPASQQQSDVQGDPTGPGTASPDQQATTPIAELPETAGPEVTGPPEIARGVDGSDSRFVTFTQFTATDLARSIGTFGPDVQQEFHDVRTASAEQAPVLRATLPGDPVEGPALQPKPKKPAPLPIADGISIPPTSSGDGLTAEETAVPSQPDGDGVSTSAGPGPKVRLEGDADPAHLATAAGQSQSIGSQISQQISSEISEVANAATIRRVGVEREEEVAVADTTATPVAQASQEMLEYINTDVPANVRAIADADFAPLLEQSLAGPRQQVQQATIERDLQRDQAFAEAVAETELASKQANEEQQKAVSDGYAQIAAEKEKGFAEGRQQLADFDAEVKQRHATQGEQIRTKVQTEQEKADEAIRKGEEDARKAEQEAEAEKKRTEEEAERNKPEEPDRKWYEEIADWFVDALNRWKDALVNAVKKVFEYAKKVVSDALTAAKNFAVGIIRSVKSFVVNAIQAFAAGLKVLVSALLVVFPQLRDRVNAAIDGVVSATVSIVETVATKLEDAVTAAVDKVQNLVNRVMDFCEMVIVTQIQIIGALLTGNFLDAAKILFLAACKAVGIPGEEFLDILADANDALLDIMKRPAKFLGYLLKSIGQGMTAFFSNFPQRLIGGLTGWLFGQIAQGGIALIKSFDLKSIFMLLIQVMGFTYEYVKTKVIQLVGEKAVGVIEQVLTPLRILFTEGPGALWQWLAEQADQVKTAIVEAASQWLVTQIITQAAIKLATMFTPVGAFVQAVLMMYNTIMFFVEKIKEIFAWVKSITSSLKTIAVGAISAAADYIDQSMSKSIPLIIAFLARLVGIGGIGEKIREVVTKLRMPVDKAITFVVENLIKLAKAAWGGIKAGAKAVKDAVVGWWEAAKNFVTPDGKQHRLFYEGEGEAAVLILASEKTRAEEAIARQREATPENPHLVTAAELVKKNEELRNRHATTPEQKQQKRDAIQQNLDAIGEQVCKVPLEEPQEEYPDSVILQAGKELLAGALYGDFADDPSYWSMIGQSVVGFTPLGIVADVRDLVASLKKLLIDGGYSDPLEWLNLALIIVGFIPGLGDLIKLAGKSTVKWLKASGVVGKFLTSGLELIAKAVKSLREHIRNVLSRVKSAILARTTRLQVDFQKQVFEQLKDYRPQFGSRIKTELASDHPTAPYRELHEPGTRNKLSTTGTDQYDRRHEVPYKEFRDELLSMLEGLTPQQMAEVLVNLGPPGGFPPQSLTPDAIADSAKKYLQWKNDDYNNLWVGPRSENRARGAAFDPDPDKIEGPRTGATDFSTSNVAGTITEHRERGMSFQNKKAGDYERELSSLDIEVHSEVGLRDVGRQDTTKRVDQLLIQTDVHTQNRRFYAVSNKSRKWQELLDSSVPREKRRNSIDDISEIVKGDTNELLNKYSGTRDLRRKALRQTATDMKKSEVIQVEEVFLVYDKRFLEGPVPLRQDSFQSWVNSAASENPDGKGIIIHVLFE